MALKETKEPSEPPKCSLFCGCLYHICLQQKLSEIKGSCSEIFTGREWGNGKKVHQEGRTSCLGQNSLNQLQPLQIDIRMIRGIKLLVLAWGNSRSYQSPPERQVSENMSSGEGAVLAWWGKEVTWVRGLPQSPGGCKGWFCELCSTVRSLWVANGTGSPRWLWESGIAALLRAQDARQWLKMATRVLVSKAHGEHPANPCFMTVFIKQYLIYHVESRNVLFG